MIHEPFILASSSPRRKELLDQAGLEFQVIPAEVDEAALEGETPEAYVRRLARTKAEKIGRGFSERLILAADTIVVLESEIMGKPEDREDAARMLTKLSGRVHRVITAYCLFRPDLNRMVEDQESTLVEFRKLSPAEIRGYIGSGEPMDKAGAYAIQGGGGSLTRRIEGSYTNVIGLPLAEVLERMRDF
ncbi:MAG: Maf family protein [Pseudomonadota bacterium]